MSEPFTLTADNPRDKLKEIMGKLEDGVKGVFESDQYKKCLETFAKFHNYSVNNCLLIAMQKPDATRVAGFHAWKTNFNRQVLKGAKGIKILAPTPIKTKQEVDKLDANGKPVIGADGQRVKEEQEITIPMFKIVTVFDISQTDGEPLPQLGVSELTGDVDKYKDFFAAIEKSSPVPIGFEVIKSGAKGYFNREENRIAINEGMSELQTLKTAIHEIAHARIHNIDQNAPPHVPRPDRRTGEVEAESIAYTVCQHYGLDTSDYSFGYIAGWSGGKEIDALKSSLDTIRKEAGAIITEIDQHFTELQQSKEQTAERPAEQAADTQTSERPTEPTAAESTPEQPTQETVTPEAPAPAALLNLTVVADYMQRQHDNIQAADPTNEQGQAAFRMVVNRLEKATERIPDEYPQLKALISNAAQSPDLPTLKERMTTLQNEFTQHYVTVPQTARDTNDKAEPPVPSATPAKGENVAAIEAKVKAGETISLTDLSDAIKKDKAAQSTTGQPTRGDQGAKRTSPGRAAKGKATSNKAQKPSIKEKISASKKQLDGQKPTPQKEVTKTKATGLGE